MLKSVTVINNRGEMTVMELRNPEKSGFLIYDISGLGPGKATVNMTEISSFDGAVYNSSRMPSRQIGISFRYLWSNTIEEARIASYKVFPLRKPVKLIFETDNRLVSIEGYVESNEPAIFEQSSYTQVSIICGDPYFYSNKGNGTNRVDFTHSVSLFEFKLPAEDSQDNTDWGIEFGLPTETNGAEFSSSYVLSDITVNYDGEADTGFDLYLKVKNTVEGFTFYKDSTIDYIKITGYLEVNDLLHICTKKGHKSITVTRNGELINYINRLDRNSKWLSLSSGENRFFYSMSVGSDTDIESLWLEYPILYEGI